MSLILKYDLGNPHRLPVGYTPLAYIESTGTQWIDTGISGEVRWVGSGLSTQTTTKSQTLLIVSGGNSAGTFVGSVGNGNKWTIKGSPFSTTYDITSKQSFNIIFKTSGPEGKIGETTINYSRTCTLDNNWIISCERVSLYPYIGKIFQLLAYKNNILVRDFIPAKNSSGVVGLFDCVSQTFFTNQGTGEFIAGPEVVVLPYEYLLVEYVGNQYINNNLIPCYRRSDLLSGIYDITNNTFLASSGILGPVVEESGRQLEYNNAGSGYIGIPTNVHHSISNPSTTQINLGSGEFDGTSSIIIADSPSENVRSASFWMNANSFSDSLSSVIFVDYKSRLAFGRTASGNYYISCGNVSTAYYSINSLISTNSWKHIVVINNGDSNTSTSRKLYINGVLLLSSGSSPSWWGVVENKLNIGLRSLVENKGFDGKIYDFRLYDHALTLDEVLQIYKGCL